MNSIDTLCTSRNLDEPYLRCPSDTALASDNTQRRSGDRDTNNNLVDVRDLMVLTDVDTQ